MKGKYLRLSESLHFYKERDLFEYLLWFQVCPWLTLALIFVAVSSAETLPKDLVFLENRLISFSEASFPLCFHAKSL